ncbi:MAG TPA: DUF2516 family protein [Intrasporangiaceae bacterium]|nr:DUF2516 family protein [Intrasporangiaceae bacterium]
MNLIGSAQWTVALVLSVAILGMEIFAFVDALRHQPDAYLRAGKRTKQLWLVVTGVAMLLGFLTLGNPLHLFALLGVVGAGVYLADVRPALQSLGGHYGGRGRDTW